MTANELLTGAGIITIFLLFAVASSVVLSFTTDWCRQAAWRCATCGSKKVEGVK